MLKINILSGNTGTGDLELDENGHPNNGHSHAKKGEDVQWKVNPGTNVESIFDIRKKSEPGAPLSDNIFVKSPRPDGSNKKLWKAKVKHDAEDFSIYNYDIEWVPVGGGVNPVYDPKISIKPPTTLFFEHVVKIVKYVLALLGIFTLVALFTKNVKRKK